ncbi:MAG: hypothetical protein EAZ66_04285, partial [Alphaproteobacteria bacterium]
MALNSINTNIAAMAAQGNIRIASNNASSSIARLSSGSRLVRASDDVASMSVGTSLRTQVSTLKTVLMNTAQGSSMLEVANGAIGQITDILVRQKELTVQAGSGSISNTERAFLNQEFSHLTAEIDRLVTSTNFNGVSLLNGALSKSVAAVTNTNRVTEAGLAAHVPEAVAAFTVGAAIPAAGTSITINGFRVEFTDALPGTAAAVGKLSRMKSDGVAAPVALTQGEMARSLVSFLNQSSDARLANLSFHLNTGTLGQVDAVYTGGRLGMPSATNFDFSIEHSTGAGLTVAASNTIRFTVPTLPVADLSQDGLTAASYDVVGSITSAHSAGAGGAPAGSQFLALNGVHLGAIATDTTVATNRGVMNNEAFIGDVLQNIEVTTTNVAEGAGGAPADGATLNFSLRVGDILYSANNVPISLSVDDTDIVLVGSNALTGAADGGSFRLTYRGGSYPLTVGVAYSAQQAAEIQTEIRQQLEGVTVRQNRNITSFNDADAVVSVDGAEVANFTNMRANFISDDFSAPDVGSTDAKIEMRINGEWYSTFAGLGTNIRINRDIALFNTVDPTKAFTFRTGTVALPAAADTAMDLSTYESTKAVQAALLKAFGVTEGQAAAQFQMGVNPFDTIGVELTSLDTKTIYNGKELDILTNTNAAKAGSQIDHAINMVKKVHADVGGIQSRFNFATANTESAIANQDAARGVFLDTDVAAESTSFATS